MNLVEAVEILFGGPDTSKAAEAATFISDDVVMYEGGDNLRTGTHRGKPAMNALMASVNEATDEFRSELVWITGDDKRVITLAHATGRRGERTLDTHVITLIDADASGRIAEVRDLPWDWQAWDEFFAR